jgi:hypothetical protein
VRRAPVRFRPATFRTACSFSACHFPNELFVFGLADFELELFVFGLADFELAEDRGWLSIDELKCACLQASNGGVGVSEYPTPPSDSPQRAGSYAESVGEL